MVSVRDLIIDDMVTTLKGVTDFGNRVYKLIPEDPSAATLPFCYVILDSEQQLEWEFGFERKQLNVDVLVAASFDQETAIEAGSETVDALLVKAQKALMVDHTRGGRAHNTTFEQMEIAPDRDESGFLTGMLRGTVIYRHAYADPEAVVP